MSVLWQRFVNEGKDAYTQGAALEDCPYPRDTATWDAWMEGWLEMNRKDPLLDDDERVERR